ncbi:pyridoxamine 5'-phosphate oxidase family protein [Geodermatophilus aquaeductus]|uniref:Nitroimidazol reductase NimA, pyridoxamine 5'-phosphate oxidase superfamily n=1 Tax=Geodermatophilus aquaeductus TaxID=1564161 RepID=A0A521APX4_9ACTN|nr:hypothetical protein SAMN06273567_101252 [Geodermatophilus aquaeductus]
MSQGGPVSTGTPLSPTPRSTVRRLGDRARTDRAELYAVLDAGLVGHLGIVLGDAPVVLPTGYGRDGDTLYLHGSTGAATLRAAATGAPVCFTVTHLDGVVYARSAFHHSMNYRCAVVHGNARLVTDSAERLHGFEVLTEHLAPGSWSATRQPDRKELAATALLTLDLTEASVKIRTGPPGDDEADLASPVWAGVLPVRTVVGEPEPCPLLSEEIPVPDRVLSRQV